MTWKAHGKLHFGWRVLTLHSIVPAPKDLIVSRSVYANLDEELQQHAVVREVRWDGAAVRKAVRLEGVDFIPRLPSRFVLASIDKVGSWLTQFKGINLAMMGPREEKRGSEIRLVRIEWDYLSQVYEIIWVEGDTACETLTMRWNQVWSEMSDVLAAGPGFRVIRENFWATEPRFGYANMADDLTRTIE